MIPSWNWFSYVYLGEYPLSFSACLCQEECYRLIMAKGADPNLQDSNGNTVLHMLVIHDKMVNGSYPSIHPKKEKKVTSHWSTWLGLSKPTSLIVVIETKLK